MTWDHVTVSQGWSVCPGEGRCVPGMVGGSRGWSVGPGDGQWVLGKVGGSQPKPRPRPGGSLGGHARRARREPLAEAQLRRGMHFWGDYREGMLMSNKQGAARVSFGAKRGGSGGAEGKKGAQGRRGRKQWPWWVFLAAVQVAGWCQKNLRVPFGWKSAPRVRWITHTFLEHYMFTVAKLAVIRKTTRPRQGEKIWVTHGSGVIALQENQRCRFPKVNAHHPPFAARRRALRCCPRPARLPAPPGERRLWKRLGDVRTCLHREPKSA